jgi:hypothetical protein
MFQPGLKVLTTPISFDVSRSLTIEAWIQPQSASGTFVCFGGLLSVAVKRIEGELCASIHLVPTEDSYVVFTGNVPFYENTLSDQDILFPDLAGRWPAATVYSEP